jgi:phosphatidate cytidylyltransferase
LIAGGDLGRRTAVAAVGIPLAFLLIYAGGWPLTLFLAALGGLAVRELFRLANAKELKPFVWMGTLGAVGLVLLAGEFRSIQAFAPWGFGALIGLLLLAFTVAIWHRWPGGRPLSEVAITVFGALYVGGCLSFGVFLRHLPETPWALGASTPLLGPKLLAFPLVVTWVGDSAAYFFGNWVGKRKLLLAVSPGKTVVGGVAGLVGSLLTGAAAGWFLLAIHPQPWASALLGGAIGLLLGVGASVGDLAESVVKREAGVKDSAGILPGHGGFLDRLDALFFNFPLTYLLFRLAGLLQ